MDTPTINALVDHVANAVEPKLVALDKASDDGTVIVTRGDQRVTDLAEMLDKRRAAPRRPSGVVVLQTIDSLIAHAKRHATTSTQAFCSLDAEPKIAVIYNDVPAADARVVLEEQGGHRDFRANYAFPLSDAWRRWSAVVGKVLSADDFATLMEDRIGDVATPGPDHPKLPGVSYATATQLLALVDGLKLRVEQSVSTVKRRDNGTADIYYREEHRTEGGEPLFVPNGFLLGIPVFVEGDPYAVPVRLRYRIASGQVQWTITLHNADDSRREAVKIAAERFRTETELPLFFGSA